MLVVKPQTYRRWLSPKTKTRSPKPAGRPGTAEDIVALILRMATENLSWGYKRIFGELKKLGIFPAHIRSRPGQTAGAARRHPRLVRAGSGVNHASFYVTSAPVFSKAGLLPAMISDGGSVPETGIQRCSP